MPGWLARVRLQAVERFRGWEKNKDMAAALRVSRTAAHPAHRLGPQRSPESRAERRHRTSY